MEINKIIASIRLICLAMQMGAKEGPFGHLVDFYWYPQLMHSPPIHPVCVCVDINPFRLSGPLLLIRPTSAHSINGADDEAALPV